MDYPGSFDTPAFPAGSRLALSRAVSIWILGAFFIAICLCGALLGAMRLQRLDPFMISVDAATGQWAVVGRDGRHLHYTVGRTMQESVVGNFVTQWFQIADNDAGNAGAWRKCTRNECASGDALFPATRYCTIYCATGEDVFTRFARDVVPDYTARAAAGQTWTLDAGSLQITPAGPITDTGGVWQVTATILTGAGTSFDIIAWAQVARNTTYYPGNMGFYIADFNAYRTGGTL
ncbi:hypothetical protein HDR63_02095 [bacterium]|nr:hypothetical protein [bacterium]